jgi:hypothetical protein
MKKGWFGLVGIAVVFSASLIGGAFTPDFGGATAEAPFTNKLFLLLETDSDSDLQAASLAPMPATGMSPPGFSGVLQPPRLSRPASSPRYTFFNPRSPPGTLLGISDPTAGKIF